MLAFETGARERMSAETSSFPGTWDMEKLNRIRRRQKRWTLIGNSSRFLEVRRGTRGLWSVLMPRLLPKPPFQFVHTIALWLWVLLRCKKLVSTLLKVVSELELPPTHMMRHLHWHMCLDQHHIVSRWDWAQVSLHVVKGLLLASPPDPLVLCTQ